MSQDRRMKWLEDNRVITACYPWSDKPTETYDWGWYYEDGTYQKYDLFWYSAKIGSIKSLKWHIFTLRFLNPDMDDEKFEQVVNYICDTKNNFITFDVNQKVIDNLISEALNDPLDYAPPNKLRKVIFKQTCGLDRKQKMKIVGSIIGKGNSLSESEIESVMRWLNENGHEITNGRLERELGKSVRTIQRAMTPALRELRDELNNTVLNEET